MQQDPHFYHVPSFGGKSASFLDYEQRVNLWDATTDIPPEKRAALLILHMGATARQVCMFSGGDTLMQGDDVRAVLQALKDYFQPDAVGNIFTQVEKFMNHKRADQPMGKFLMEFGILGAKAEKLMFPGGGGFPDL